MAETPALEHSVTLWSAEPAERAGRPLLVLLHGYGADERDLFGLAGQLPPEFVIAAVRAPLNLPWPAPGYSWYPIEALNGRHGQDVSAAASRLIEWLEYVAPDGPVGLLGFSQGAAVAIQAMRSEPERFSFIVNLSGYAAPGELEGDEALTVIRPPLFWGRGTHDDVIPAALIEHTVQWLPTHCDLSGRVYAGLTHSVSEGEFEDVRIFLHKQLDALAADDTPAK